MPIYEYECTSCGKRIESIQKMNDAPLVDCPECGKPALHKLVSAPSFQLKGTGWYVTDFRDKKSEHKPESHKTDSTTETTSSAETPKAATSTEEKKSETKTTETKTTTETKKTDTSE